VTHGISNLTGPVDDIIRRRRGDDAQGALPAYTAFFDGALGSVNTAAFNEGVTVGKAMLSIAQMTARQPC